MNCLTSEGRFDKILMENVKCVYTFTKKFHRYIKMHKMIAFAALFIIG
jgi:hypothetical protein